MRIIPITLVCIALAGCDQSSANRVLQSLTIQSTGHDLDGAAAEPSSEEAVVIADTPPPSSSVYVPPLGEACDEGTSAFRLWDCVDGHRQYW